MATSTTARYEVASVPPAHTPDELAAHWVAELDVACTAATPSFAAGTGAYAKWAGRPLMTGLTAAYAFDTKTEQVALDGTTGVPDDGTVHIVVCAGNDTDTTATVAPVADAIDQAVLGSLTVDGAMASAVTTTCKVHAAEAAAVALLQQCLDVDGFCYLLVGNEAEVIKVTDIDVDGVTLTIVRGAAGSTPSSSWDDDEALYWYCGADNTVIGVDDETVWGTIASHTAAGGHLVVICGTEQMLVSDLIAGTIPDTFVGTRGYDSTTAAVHADNAAVTQYIDEDTAIFSVSNGALLVDECLYKVGTAGTEVIKVKTISTHKITVTRACYNSAPAVFASGAAIFRLWGPEIYDAALLAVNTIADGTFHEGRYGACNFNLGRGLSTDAAWSTETQAEIA